MKELKLTTLDLSICSLYFAEATWREKSLPRSILSWASQNATYRGSVPTFLELHATLHTKKLRSSCRYFRFYEGLFFTMGGALLSEFLLQILIPVATVIGIGFALLQWMLVSRVKVGPEKASSVNNGVYNEFLLDEAEEDGGDLKNDVPKCAEI